MMNDDECGLGLLDLKFKFENGKTAVDFFAKSAINFIYAT